ncbi:MAG: ISL3 family transposase [Mesoflavibacter sp.]|nr:ISL3 family transposase [Mesoflavibacter sp.]
MDKNREQKLNIPVELLGIPNIAIKKIIIDKDDKIIILAESTEEDTKCHKCGRKADRAYGYGEEITLRHLALFGHEVYIRIKVKRYECGKCGSITNQELSWYDKRSSHTKAYQDYILLLLVNSTVLDVCIKENIGYDEVSGMIDRKIKGKVDWNEVKGVKILGIDEISLKKGYQDFVTIITGRCGDKLLLLGILKGKDKSTVKEFLKSIPKKVRKQVKVVCTDMYEGFTNAVKEVFSKKVQIVVDRFHVAQLYRKSVDKLRVKEMKRLKEELSEEEYKKLKGVMWILRKKEKDLTLEDKEVLKLLFKYSPDLKLAYGSSNQLTSIFNSNLSKFHAKHKINSWIRGVEKSGLNCFRTFIKTLIKFKDEITNYFVDRNTSGFVEGLNNKIKAIKRRCYGILNIEHLFQRIYLDMCGFSLFLLRTKNQRVT